MAKSREGLTLIMMILGALFAVSGIVFILQGNGTVGPGSSFMFRNNTWIYYGAIILAGGLVLIGAGIGLRPRGKKVTPAAVEPEENKPSPSEKGGL